MSEHDGAVDRGATGWAELRRRARTALRNPQDHTGPVRTESGTSASGMPSDPKTEASTPESGG